MAWFGLFAADINRHNVLTKKKVNVSRLKAPAATVWLSEHWTAFISIVINITVCQAVGGVQECETLPVCV